MNDRNHLLAALALRLAAERAYWHTGVRTAREFIFHIRVFVRNLADEPLSPLRETIIALRESCEVIADAEGESAKTLEDGFLADAASKFEQKGITPCPSMTSPAPTAAAPSTARP